MATRQCPYARGTFRAIQWASPGGIWIVCMPCRRYRPLYVTADIADRLWARTWFRCRHCGGRSQASGRDPRTAPECQGFELDIGAIEGALRQPEPPAPVWLPGDHDGLEAVREKGLLILAEIDWRPVVLVVWLDGALDGLPRPAARSGARDQLAAVAGSRRGLGCVRVDMTKAPSPTRAERLARQLCRTAAEESERRGKSHLYGYMLSTITELANATDDEALEAALQFAEKQRWVQATPRGTFMLLEAGRQILKAKS